MVIDAASAATAALVFAALAGVVMTAFGFSTYRTGQRIANTRPETISAVRTGRAEISGTATPAEKLFDNPFTTGECVYATYRMEEQPDGSGRSDWRTITSGSVGAPFYVEDDTGRMLVDTDDNPMVDVSGIHTTRYTVGSDESPPATVRDVFDSNHQRDWRGHDQTLGGLEATVRAILRALGLERPTPANRRRRYSEQVIPVGEEVSVFGGVERRLDDAADGDELVMRTDDETGAFFVTDCGQSELERDLKRRGVFWLGVGLLVTPLLLVLVVLQVTG